MKEQEAAQAAFKTVAKDLDRRMQDTYMEIEERSRLSLALSKIASDPEYAVNLLTEAAFFGQELPKKTQTGLPLIERIKTMDTAELLSGLRYAVAMMPEGSDEGDMNRLQNAA